MKLYITVPVGLFMSQNRYLFKKGGVKMALVKTKEMFKKAYEGGYAIGAFNINNMEILQGVVNGAKAKNSAVILQCSTGALKYAGPKYLKAMVDAAIEETGMDVALHLITVQTLMLLN